MADKITFYFDYLCPWAYRATKWLAAARTQRDYDIKWRTFSLRDNNRPEGSPSFFLADTAGDALVSLELAKFVQAKQPGLFDIFHARMFAAFHEDHQRPNTEETYAIAASVGIDTNRFKQERGTGAWLAAAGVDHRKSKDEWEVFGVPTLVFDDSNPIFLKMKDLPQSDAAAAKLFDLYFTVARDYPGVVEVKYSKWS